MIEWKSDRTSTDGEWIISRDGRINEPVWVYFETYPSAVKLYVDDHPGDTDAWLGQYHVSIEEMHAPERLLKIVAKAKRSKK